MLEPKIGFDIRAAVSERLNERKKTLLLLQSNEMTLEQIFLRLTEADDLGLFRTEKKADAPASKIKVDLESGEAVVGEETEAEKEFEKDENE